MSIKPKFIGFLGLDSYDLVILIARFLDNLEQRVLIMDCSELGRLSYCIPIPVSLNPQKDLIHYKNMKFVRGYNENVQVENYNYIIIDFGGEVDNSLLQSCEIIYIITDMQQHNMECMMGLNTPDATIYLLIKNFFHSTNLRYIDDYFKEKLFTIKDCYLFPTSEMDLENMVMLQYFYDIKLNKVSKQLKKLIHTILINHFNFDEKVILKIRKLNNNHLKERRNND